MKKAYITVGLLLTISILIITGCTQTKTVLRTKCCNQCIEGSKTDNRAFDTSTEDCSHYKEVPVFGNDGRPTDDKIFDNECITYFENNPTTVSECK